MMLRVLVLALVACGGRVKQFPQRPPATLEAIAEQPGAQEREVPDPRPLRRGPCGIPIAISSEGLAQTSGIARVQAELVDRGLLARGAFVRGELDEPTLAAIRDFQQRADLPPVGLPNYATIEALELPIAEVFHTGDATCGGEG